MNIADSTFSPSNIGNQPVDSERILIIDDDSVDRKLIRRMLSENNYNCIEASSAVDAHELIINEENIDCVLLDYFLPANDFNKLVRDCRNAILPYIVITGSGSENVAVVSLRQFAYDYVRKECVTPKLLHQSVQRAITLHQKKVNFSKQLERNLEFLHEFVHDVKAPLRSIKEFVNILSEEISEQNYNDANDCMIRIVRGAQFVNKLVDEMLLYSTIQNFAVDKKIANTQLIVEDVISALGAIIDSNDAKISYKNLPEIKGSIPHLKRLFQNLIINAIQHKHPRRHLCIEINVERKKTEYHFSVSDNGQGIEKNDLEKIFKPFVSINTNSNNNSTGLGLAICNKIVSQHGGRIWVESTLDEGSTFLFTLPK